MSYILFVDLSDPLAVLQDLEEHRFQIIITSPEMCLEHPRFSKLIRSSEWTKHLKSIVVDEAHCVMEWGKDFRPEYGKIDRLRSWIPSRVAWLAVSATLPPDMLEELRTKLEISARASYHINLGNDIPNISDIVWPMKTGAGLSELNFLVHGVAASKVIIRTIVFFETRELAQSASDYLKSRLPEDLRARVGYLHSLRSSYSKKTVLEDFHAKKLDILCATEAAGMVRVQDSCREDTYS